MLSNTGPNIYVKYTQLLFQGQSAIYLLENALVIPILLRLFIYWRTHLLLQFYSGYLSTGERTCYSISSPVMYLLENALVFPILLRLFIYGRTHLLFQFQYCYVFTGARTCYCNSSPAIHLLGDALVIPNRISLFFSTYEFICYSP